MTIFRPILLLVASIAFGLGISLPLIRFEKFFIFEETPSLLDVVWGLWEQDNPGLAVLVGLFSLVFPVIKLFTIFESALGSGRFPAWAGILSKWSMMDVLLVAILIFAAKTSGVAAAVSQPGVWFYALSSIATACAALGLGGKR